MSGPSVAIATQMLEDRVWCREFIALARRRVEEAYVFFTGRLEEIGIKYSEGGAGFFVFVDLSPWLGREGGSQLEREIELAERFLEKGVLLQPGEEHSVRVGWFRLVFTMEREVVEEGLRRIERVVKELSCRMEGV